MNITEFIRTTGAIAAIAMLQIGAFWLKQHLKALPNI